MSETPFNPTGGDDELEQELREALGSMSVDSLMDADEKPAAKTEGVKVGRVISIQKDDIFVDMGGKSQGLLPAIQFEDEPLPAVGDWVEVIIEGYNKAEGLLVLSRKGAVVAATWQSLEEGQVVEGRVTGHNKGGLELDVNGIRAFMPISQVDILRTEELAPYENQKLRCEVTEVRKDERAIVVSRRLVLQRDAAEAKEKMFETLQEGQTVSGVVRSIMPYGAFVDLGGVDGLLHIGDMSYSRVKDAHDIVKEGQRIEVMILKIDREARKLGLGLKQVQPDPWSDIENKYPAGTTVGARITRLEQFGAFAELEPGVEGLIPISEMTYERRLGHPSEVVKEGDVVRVRVLGVEKDRRRIGLSLKQVGDDPWIGAEARWPANSIVEGKVSRVTDFGAFIELTPGVEGLVHISELSDRRVGKVAEVAKPGQAIRAKVLEVDEERRRISLSIKQLADMGEEWDPAAAPPPAAGPEKKRKKPLKGGLEWGF